jgi:hypothetical protein
MSGTRTLQPTIQIRNMAVHNTRQNGRKIQKRRILLRIRSTDAEDGDLSQIAIIGLYDRVDEVLYPAIISICHNPVWNPRGSFDHTVVPIMTAEMLSLSIPDRDIAPSMAVAIPSVTSGVVGVLNELRMPRCGWSASPGSANSQINIMKTCLVRDEGSLYVE